MQSKTTNDFKQFMLKHGLSFNDVADITGLKRQSVWNQLQTSAKLPTWAKTMMYGYTLANPVTPAPIIVVEGLTEYNCGCKHEGKLFRRAKGCKIEIKEHRV